MTTTITATTAPTGGIVSVVINSADVGPWTLTRQVVSGPGAPATAAMYSGPAPANQPWTFIDIGDQTNLPLDQGTSYTWTLTTASSTTVSSPVTPAAQISLDYDDFTVLILRTLQAGLPSVSPPSGAAFKNTIKAGNIQLAMPLTGSAPLPRVAVNPDLVQQGDVPIGHGLNTDYVDNEYDVTGMELKRYSITVMTTTAEERDFYRISILAILKTMLGAVFTPMGQNITSKYQAASSQKTSRQNDPGFYFAEIGFTFTGQTHLKVVTNYGVVGAVVANTTASS